MSFPESILSLLTGQDVTKLKMKNCLLYTTAN